jgi:hypothetical protein
MISNNPNKAINLDLVDLVCDNIPEWTWAVVKEQLIDAMVDVMPTHILEKLTGDPTGDERALEILDDYYKSDELNKDLIVDSFRILGEDQTTYLLDALQLEKIQQPTNNND